ncbi:MAG: family transposase [Verrucomicrobiales bacterium]|nr:family transposase [Verrucomicrobiales bacterium]
MRGRSCKQIEVDEIWGFVGMKNKMASVLDEAEGMGDVWTFIALDSENKIIPSYLVGKRVAYHANTFIGDMAERLKSRVQLSSDSLKAYADVVERGFGAEVDYGQISKTYSLTLVNNAPANVRYSPAQVVQTEKKVISGKPDVDLNSTSHIEKQNHTLRMHCRRLTRLTNTFSKKRENFEAAVALNFAYYNFCKIHTTIRCTTAMQAGIEKSQWSVAELVERCGE